MVVVISKAHASLNDMLAKEANKLAVRFNVKNYSRIESIENVLIKRDISVENKKRILVKKLHDLIVKAFSIDKKKFNKKAFGALKRRLQDIRRIIIKLRSINYYLETSFLEDLKLSKINLGYKNLKLKEVETLARDELEALEYTAYKLIGKSAMLDKKVLSEYSKKERKVVEKGRVDIKDLGFILKKESLLLEHLEAKLPPPKATSITLIEEPVFTHWVARVFALLAYLEHMYLKEKKVFAKLKKNKLIKKRISKKIKHLIKERSELIRIMEEKASSMKKLVIDDKFKKEFHNFTTTIAL